MSRIAKPGDTVTVRYIGTLDNGRIFAHAEEDPLTLTLGNDEVFPALEEGIVGMRVGEVKNIVLPAAEAYGRRRAENILTVRRGLFPAGRDIRVGEKLELEFGGAGRKVMRVVETSEQEVVLDGNHPLAGLDLTFALQLDAIL